MQPGDAELVEGLRAAGWYSGVRSYHDAWRWVPLGSGRKQQRDLTPAQWRALQRLERGRKADER